MRTNGYYWVILKGNLDWEVGLFMGGVWSLVGTNDSFEDCHFSRIATPINEPWQAMEV